MRYVEMPGEGVTGFHDRVLGLIGDIRPRQCPVVKVPATTFHLITPGSVRVPTLAAMPAVLAGWNEQKSAILGPYTDQDPVTELVRPCHVQLLPGRYAALLIHRQQVMPTQAYYELTGAIVAYGFTEACADLLTWLRAACTARGGAGPQNMTPGVLHTFNPVHLPDPVFGYVSLKIQQDLPGLAAGDTAPAAPQLATQLATALQALVGARRATGDGAGPKEPKTIMDSYKETYRVLLRYCNVAGVEEVAPVWCRIASAHKSEQMAILNQELNKVCMA